MADGGVLARAVRDRAGRTGRRCVRVL